MSSARCLNNRAMMRVLVFGDQQAIALTRKLPRRRVERHQRQSAGHAGNREEVVQQLHQLFGQLLVEERRMNSGGGNAEGPALVLRHSARQVPKNVTDGNAGAADTGLAERMDTACSNEGACTILHASSRT